VPAAARSDSRRVSADRGTPDQSPFAEQRIVLAKSGVSHVVVSIMA